MESNPGTLSLRKEILSHLFFWLLLIYFTLVRFDSSNPYFFSFAETDVFSVSWAGIFILSFYFNYLLIMPWVFRSFSWKKAVQGYLACYLFFVGSRFLLEEALFPLLIGQSNYSEGTAGVNYLYDNLYYSSLPLLPSIVFWLVVYVIRQLQAKNRIIEENRNTEVKFLKAQLNPHFLFNTLNNIYSMVYLQSEKALPAIEKLSGIMRFTTYELQKEKIKLAEELQYIRSYIDLERLRLPEDFFIQLQLNPKDSDLELPPFLLSPLVENALKHGFTTKEAPLEIHLDQKENLLRFRVSNLVNSKKKDPVGGVGLENLKKRLDIYFPDRHSLMLSRDNGIYKAQLEIQF